VTRQLALAVVVGLAALGGGCEEEPAATSFPVRFRALADGVPVEGARIGAGGAELGVTGPDGRLDVTLAGSEGRVVPVTADCPDGYRDPREPPRLTLQRLRQLDERDRLRRVRIDVECRPEERTAMLLVRAGGLEAIPVLVDGREVARTDAHGLAHVALTSPPHERFDVVLRTDHLEDVLPRNPPHTVTVPDRDEVFVIDQRFTRLEPDRPRRPGHRGPRGPRLPQKIVAGHNPPMVERSTGCSGPPRRTSRRGRNRRRPPTVHGLLWLLWRKPSTSPHAGARPCTHDLASPPWPPSS